MCLCVGTSGACDMYYPLSLSTPLYGAMTITYSGSNGQRERESHTWPPLARFFALVMPSSGDGGYMCNII